MKVCVIQPPYSFDYSQSDANYRWELEEMDKCDPSMDLIVLPEYSNVPALSKTKEQMLLSRETYSAALFAKAAETARRCAATVFISGIVETESGLRNAIVAYNSQGEEVGQYHKQHLVNSEMFTYELDKEYTWDFSEPTILEIDGVRYGFLICYDFYFYEAYANIARHDPDIIIGCSHQRSDRHSALETMCKFLAYNTNAYVVRSSVSLGADSEVGGGSMVVTPDGAVLCNMKSEVGHACAEINPHKRYLKPAGFGNPDAPHHHYVEAGRRPWKYRPGGSAIVRYDEWMAYPRVCAHRGFNSVAPENSLPAYGAAVALGAEEIEFDLWATADGVIVSAHDRQLERVSNGKGLIDEHTFAELRALDFGSVAGEAFVGMQIPTFEEILQKLACHTVMNIHIKSPNNTDPLPEATLCEIVRLIDKYDCRRHCYFMCGNKAILNQLREIAPDIIRCAGAGDDVFDDLVQKALDTGAKKIQLFKPHFAANGGLDYVKATIDRAHANGIRCNVFYADDPAEAQEYIRLGADTILTNDYLRIAQAVKSVY